MIHKDGFFVKKLADLKENYGGWRIMGEKVLLFLGILPRKAASSSWLWGRAKEEDKREKKMMEGRGRKKTKTNGRDL